MTNEFDTLLASRELTLKFVQDFTPEQLNYIPKGFKNNLIWNLGHMVVTQQLLWYDLAGKNMLIPNEMVEKYRKGSQPKATVDEQEIIKIKELLVSLPKKSIADYKNGIFDQYNSYTTSFNVSLNTIKDGIKFNNFHEGLHVGTIMALRKLCVAV